MPIIRMRNIRGDTGSGKGIDAARVVQGGVDGVGSNDIDVQLLQERNVSIASSDIAQGINESRLTVLVRSVSNGWLIRHTLDIELCSVRVEEFGSLPFSTINDERNTLMTIDSMARMAEGRVVSAARAIPAENFMIAVTM